VVYSEMRGSVPRVLDDCPLTARHINVVLTSAWSKSYPQSAFGGAEYGLIARIASRKGTTNGGTPRLSSRQGLQPCTQSCPATRRGTRRFEV